MEALSMSKSFFSTVPFNWVSKQARNLGAEQYFVILGGLSLVCSTLYLFGRVRKLEKNLTDLSNLQRSEFSEIKKQLGTVQKELYLEKLAKNPIVAEDLKQKVDDAVSLAGKAKVLAQELGPVVNNPNFDLGYSRDGTPVMKNLFQALTLYSKGKGLDYRFEPVHAHGQGASERPGDIRKTLFDKEIEGIYLNMKADNSENNEHSRNNAVYRDNLIPFLNVFFKFREKL